MRAGKNKILPLSVCMATYNGGRYLRQQLESILPQLGPDDELVISDDSSTDDTLAIIAGCNDPRIRVFAGNTYYNPARNFENALRQARGEIIVLSDQDDLWLPGKLAIVREELGGKVARPALLQMDGEIIDVNGTVLAESIFALKRSGPGLLRNIYDSSYPGCCMAFTRPLLQLALPLPRRVPMHDWWIALLAELFGEITFVAGKTIRYRRHGENASFTSGNRFLQIGRRLLIALLLAGRYLSIKLAFHGKV